MCGNGVYAAICLNVSLNSFPKFLESKTFLQKGFGRRRQKRSPKKFILKGLLFLRLGDDMKITVLCGGNSPEREVSLRSGIMVANALRLSGHEVNCVDVLTGMTPPFKKTHPISQFSPIHESVIPLCLDCDKVFLALHGGIGENGQLQAFLDCLGVSYTGSSYVPSLLCMDKALTRTILFSFGVPIPRGKTVTKAEDHNWNEFPCCVKPADAGSSIGISFAEDEKSLKNALDTAFSVCDRVIVEEKLVGRELTVGMLDSKTLPIVEIIPKTEFYNYESKYDPALVTEICPARLTEEEKSAVNEVALRAASALLVDSYCRVDIILSDGVPYCLEINTLPGMTETSLLPLAAKANGISFPQLCEKILKQ